MVNVNKILVVAPHPDDEVLGCGGAIARHTAHGDEVHVVIVTRGIPEMFHPNKIERIRLELQAAHEILRVKKTHFLDFPAPGLDSVPGYQVADAIRRVLEQVRPTTVYVPHRGDINSDHRVTYLATLVAARPVNGCSTRRLLSYETVSETEWAAPFSDEAFIPTVFIDITRFLCQKLEAVGCYRSQLKTPPHPRSLEAIEDLSRARGRIVSIRAAEAFVLVREIVE